MIDKALLNQVVIDKIIDTDYFIVDIKISVDNSIIVELDCKEGVDTDFCVSVLRHIESVFDREEEDYSLEVGSAGLTSPFKVLKQYQKNLGNDVEVLSKSGLKLSGVLIEADEDKFAIEIEKKVKPEGAKRKVIITERLEFLYEEVKYTKYNIRFK